MSNENYFIMATHQKLTLLYEYTSQDLQKRYPTLFNADDNRSLYIEFGFGTPAPLSGKPSTIRIDRTNSGRRNLDTSLHHLYLVVDPTYNCQVSSIGNFTKVGELRNIGDGSSEKIMTGYGKFALRLLAANSRPLILVDVKKSIADLVDSLLKGAPETMTVFKQKYLSSNYSEMTMFLLNSGFFGSKFSEIELRSESMGVFFEKLGSEFHAADSYQVFLPDIEPTRITIYDKHTIYDSADNDPHKGVQAPKPTEPVSVNIS